MTVSPHPSGYFGTVMRDNSATGYSGIVNVDLTVTLIPIIGAGVVENAPERHEPNSQLCVEDASSGGLSSTIMKFRCVPGDSLTLHTLYDPADPLIGYTELHVTSLVPIEADDGGVASYIQIRRLLAICESDTSVSFGSAAIPDIAPTFSPTRNLTTSLDSGDSITRFSVPNTEGGIGMYRVTTLECEWVGIGANSQTQDNFSVVKAGIGQRRAQRRRT